MNNVIISNIINNPKRMAKLRAIKKGTDVRNKAKGFVIGEAAILKVRLTDEEVIKAAVKIVAAL